MVKPKSNTKKIVNVSTLNLTESVPQNRVRELIMGSHKKTPYEWEYLISMASGKATQMTYTTNVDDPSGRYEITNKKSLFRLSKGVRAYLCQDNYLDLDIKNCYPSILENLTIMHGVEGYWIKQYNKNRDQPTYRAVKLDVIKIINGHDTKVLLPNFLKNNIPQAEKMVEGIVETVKLLIKKLKPDIDIEKCDIGYEITLILTKVERSTIDKAMNILKSFDVPIIAYCYDGLIVGNLGKIYLGSINEAIFPFEMTIKPWDVPENVPIGCANSFDWEDKAVFSDLLRDVSNMTYDTFGHMDDSLFPIVFKTIRLIGGEACLVKIDGKNYQMLKITNKLINGVKFWLAGRVFPMSLSAVIDRYIPYISTMGMETISTNNINKFCTWRGFGFKPLQADEAVDEDLFKNLLFLMKAVLCSDNGELADHFIKWLASIIQKPDTKTEVAYIFCGKEGVGKSTVGRIIDRLFGSHNICKMSGVNNLTRNFNSQLEGKLIIWCEELRSSTRNDFVADHNRLKDLIDASIIDIERKGMDVIHVKNVLNVIGFSNHYHCMPLGEGLNRRVIITEVGDLKQGDREFFSEINKAIDDDVVMRHFFTYLARYDLSDFNVRIIPTTQLKKNAVYLSKTPVEKALNMLFTTTFLSQYGDDRVTATNEFEKSKMETIKWISTKEVQDVIQKYAFNRGEIRGDHVRLGNDIRIYLGTMDPAKRRYSLKLSSKFRMTLDDFKYSLEYLDGECIPDDA